MNFAYSAHSQNTKDSKDGVVGHLSHVALVPSYNTGTRLFDTVAAIRQRGLPVRVVIDGSTDGTGERLLQIAADDPEIQVVLLTENRGKGEAVLHGLRLAQRQGFTHVVTIDADGQHRAEDIDAFVGLSLAHPEAMVLGVPVFDDSAPAIRVAGHCVANFCSGVATLWAGIGDSLFGFRVYPIAPLLQAFQTTRWMRRFDFDSEAVIRLSWQGVPAINLPTPVRYFRRQDGGVSHFNYVRDNGLLFFMYFRLFFGLLAHLPDILIRRFRSSHH